MSYHQQLFQNHLTIVVGPPKIKEIEDNAKNWLCTHPPSVEDAWFEHIANTVFITTMPEPKDETILDSFMSHVLGQKVNTKPFVVAKTYRGEKMLPALYLYEQYVTIHKGGIVSIENYTKSVRQMIGEYFHKLLKSQWIHVSTSMKPI